MVNTAATSLSGWAGEANVNRRADNVLMAKMTYWFGG